MRTGLDPLLQGSLTGWPLSVLQVHTTDFPGNYSGYDDAWDQDRFEKVSGPAGVRRSEEGVLNAEYLVLLRLECGGSSGLHWDLCGS